MRPENNSDRRGGQFFLAQVYLQESEKCTMRMNNRHSALKVAAPCVLVVHEPELHGRHGGLEAGAGDPHGPRALQMLLVPLMTNIQQISPGVLHCML